MEVNSKIRHIGTGVKEAIDDKGTEFRFLNLHSKV